MGEHEQEQTDDGGATAGSSGEQGAAATPGGSEEGAHHGDDPAAGADIDTEGGDVVVNQPEGGDAAPAEGDAPDEQHDRTPDGETQTGADPQPE